MIARRSLLPIRAGELRFGAARLDGLPPHRIAALGVAVMPEGGRLFDELSVGENLAIGTYLPAARSRAPKRARSSSGCSRR